MTVTDLTAWHWRKGHLIKEGDFNVGDAGHVSAFEAYLQYHATHSFSILVDIPDEAFRIDETPYASSRDRKGILRRRLERHFPGATLVTAIPLGRSGTGRCDDRFLFCALIRSLDPWMTVLRRTESRLAGVFSMFQAMSSLAKQRGLSTLPYVMVSITNTGLRQTFFKGGTPLLSRLIRIDPKKPLQDTLTEESRKMRQYLVGQQGLSHDEPLPCFVLAHGVPALQEPFIFWESDTPVEQVLLMSLALNRPRQQFASPDDRCFHHAAGINMALRIGGSFILASCGVAGFMQSQPVLALRDSIVEANVQEQQHEASLKRLPSPPMPWAHLQGLMTQLDAVQNSTMPPQTVLSTFAHALATFPEIDPIRFSWMVTEGLPVANFSGKLSPRLSINLREKRITVNALVSRIAALPTVREVQIENHAFEDASDQLFRSDTERSDRFSLRIVLKP